MFIREQELLEFFNNELVGYIIDITAIIMSVFAGIVLLYGKFQKAFASAKAIMNKNNEDTQQVNNNLNATNLRIENVNERYDKIVAELKERQQEMQKQYDENIAQLKAVIATFEPIQKLPNAMAKMISCTPNLVENGTAKRFCDELGLNDTNFDKAEQTQQETVQDAQ